MKKTIFTGLALAAVLALGACSTPGTPVTVPPAAVSDAPVVEPAPVVEQDTSTPSQKNALRQAESYLKYTAFSYTSLIEQLEYENFTPEDATWAADHSKADWNEQAARKAKSYLEFTGFSHQGLVDQLLFEGFTPEQAEFGVVQTGL